MRQSAEPVRTWDAGNCGCIYGDICATCGDREAMSDDELWAKMNLPVSFGKQNVRKKVDLSARMDKTRRVDEPPAQAPPRTASDKIYVGHDGMPPPASPKLALGSAPVSSKMRHPPESSVNADNKYDDDEEGDDDDEDEDDSSALNTPAFPITHEVALEDHTKVVSALSLDPSGARIASGSHDYECKLWDFGGMTAARKPFKSWEAAGSYYIHDMKYSNAGDYILVIPGTHEPLIYDRDGQNHDTFAKGDPYIRDMRHTDGHVGELTSGAWHPKDSKVFITSSNDSTIRIWDVENRRKQKTVIVVKSKERGTRTKITACNYNQDGKVIAGAGLDGTLHLWSTSGTYARPSSSIEGAHTKGTETGSLSFSHDGHTLLSRGGDGTVKLWDTRAFKKPVVQSSVPLPSLYPETNAMFSPDEKYVVAGRSALGKTDRGALVILRRDTLDVVNSVDCAPGVGVVRVFWHSKINQIVTGLSNGHINVLYSPTSSQNGAKLLLTKSAKKVTIEEVSRAQMAAPIMTPHALPMFRDDGPVDGEGMLIAGGKRKRDQDKISKRKSQRPDAPLTGPGRGGRVGASATQHVVQNLVRDSTRDQDPREALLKYADTENNPQWTSAWKDQPKVFSSAPDEVEEEDE